MTAALTTTAEPTEEQLLEAWQRRRRPDWPATFEEVMLSPNHACLVRLEARLTARGVQTSPTVRQRPTVERPEPPPADKGAPTAPARHAPIARRTAPTFDNKRLASGERDDDE